MCVPGGRGRHEHYVWSWSFFHRDCDIILEGLVCACLTTILHLLNCEIYSPPPPLTTIMNLGLFFFCDLCILLLPSRFWLNICFYSSGAIVRMTNKNWTLFSVYWAVALQPWTLTTSLRNMTSAWHHWEGLHCPPKKMTILAVKVKGTLCILCHLRPLK